jgi:uncharacterized protein (DUF1810 family)
MGDFPVLCLRIGRSKGHKKWGIFRKMASAKDSPIARLPSLPDINNPSPFGGFLK